MTQLAYGFGKTLQHASFDQAVAAVTEALKGEGFGVLAQIDVQATLKAKLGTDVGRYLILGACNPGLARQAIAAEPQIGLLLPCNVLVRELSDGGVEVSIADPQALFSLVGNPQARGLADEVKVKLERVLQALG